MIDLVSSDNTASRNCSFFTNFLLILLDLNFFSITSPFSVKISTPFSSLLNNDILGMELILIESINLFELKCQTFTTESLEHVVNKVHGHSHVT